MLGVAIILLAVAYPIAVSEPEAREFVDRFERAVLEKNWASLPLFFTPDATVSYTIGEGSQTISSVTQLVDDYRESAAYPGYTRTRIWLTAKSSAGGAELAVRCSLEEQVHEPTEEVTSIRWDETLTLRREASFLRIAEFHMVFRGEPSQGR